MTDKLPTMADLLRLQNENYLLRLERDRERMSHLITSGVLVVMSLCLVWSMLQ